MLILIISYKSVLSEINSGALQWMNILILLNVILSVYTVYTMLWAYLVLSFQNNKSLPDLVHNNLQYSIWIEHICDPYWYLFIKDFLLHTLSENLKFVSVSSLSLALPSGKMVKMLNYYLNFRLELEYSLIKCSFAAIG